MKASISTTCAAAALLIAGAAFAQTAPAPQPPRPAPQAEAGTDGKGETRSDLPGYRPLQWDSTRQRHDALEADRQRTTGELNPYPNAPIGMPAPAEKPAGADKPSK